MKDIMEGISPLPWSLREATKFDVVGPEGEWVATSTKPSAAYIVHCANLYPELVEALENMLDWSGSLTCPAKWSLYLSDTEKAKAILAKCKAGAE